MNIQIPSGVDKPDFWERFYKQGMMPWDFGTFAPPLKTFLDSPYRMPPGKVAVLGCGLGHDCMLMLKYGYEVTGIDFAPSAILATYEKIQPTGLAGKRAFLLQKCIFDLGDYTNYFDYILEHNCFCALHLYDRRRYVFCVRDLLKPRGKILGLWFVGEHEGGGLPFSISKNELFDLFDEDFSIDISYDPQDSFPSEQGKELITLMTKRA